MSIAAMAWAKRQKTGSATRKAVLMAIADYADAAGSCWPSQRAIMEETELSERAVRNALAELADAGLLNRVERRRPDGSRASDMLTLNMGEQPAPDAGGGAPDAPGVGHDVPGGGAPRAGLTTFEPPSEPDAVDADAREPAWITLGRRVMVAMGVEFGDPRWTGSLGRVSQWLADGFDPDLDILPTVEAVMAKRGGRGPPTTLNFFDRPIADAKARRVAPMPTGNATTTTRPQHDLIAAFDRLDDRIAQAAARHRG
jgi:hypothetical protein